MKRKNEIWKMRAGRFALFTPDPKLAKKLFRRKSCSYMGIYFFRGMVEGWQFTFKGRMFRSMTRLAGLA